jgi:hypothetical protein
MSQYRFFRISEKWNCTAEAKPTEPACWSLEA